MKYFLSYKDYKKELNNEHKKSSTLERENIFLDMPDFLFPLKYHKSGISS